MKWFYTGPVYLMKGASSAEENLQESQTQFYNNLTDMFQSQFSNAQNIQNFMKSYLEPLIQNPQGYDAQTLAAMRTGASENVASNYQNALRATQTQQALTGGRMTPSGVAGTQLMTLNNAAAATNANAQNSITQQNAALKQQNFWNAQNALMGVGNMANSSASSLLSGANSAFNGAFNAANTINQQNTAASPWGIVGGALGGAANSILGGLTGGLGTVISGMGSGNWGW